MARTRRQDAERKRAESRANRIVHIPPVDDRGRRLELERDPFAWLRYYAAHVFTYEFTDQQRQMIDALWGAMVYGGDQALAASRGEGKTSLCEWVLTAATLSGIIGFGVLFQATGTDAEQSLATIKEQLITDEDDNQPGDDISTPGVHRLFADYPEVCYPVFALEGAPQRAPTMIATGARFDTGKEFTAQIKFTWAGRKITLPRVPGSPSRGSILATRGLDAAVRGLKVGTRRPDVCVIDDPDTDETVANEEQRDKLIDKIEKTIAGLAGQKKRMARVMLTTIQRQGTVSAWYTDPRVKASWKGKRFRFLIDPPERLDLWDEYIQTRSAEMEAFGIGESADEHARKSHAFYLANLDEMRRGAKVANPNRYDSSVLPDGTTAEHDALQRYFNLVADIGQEAVDTEYQNDPPEESGPIESGITAYRVQTQTNGFARKEIPPGCITITQGIDVRKVALHWVVRAWQHDGTGFTIDYGVTEVRGTVRGSDEGVDLAVRRAIIERMDNIAEEQPYKRSNGEVVAPAMTLVDAGWRTEAVYGACLEWHNSDGLRLMPSMGHGKSAGCARANFSDTQTQSAHRRSGDGFFLTRRPVESTELWLVNLDADRWKAWEHDRWMTDLGRVGALSTWGAPMSADGRLSRDQRDHFSYSKHIVAEVEVEEVKDGILERYWKSKSDTNHYLDASAMADAAARMCGVKLLRRVQQAAAAAASAPQRRQSSAPGDDDHRVGRHQVTNQPAQTNRRW